MLLECVGRLERIDCWKVGERRFRGVGWIWSFEQYDIVGWSAFVDRYRTCPSFAFFEQSF